MRSFSILIGSFSPSSFLAIEPTIRSRPMGDDSGRDLHLPADGAPSAAAVVLHPHPAMGGDRHHPLVVALAEGLSAAGRGRRSGSTCAIRASPPSADALAVEAPPSFATEVGVERLAPRRLLVGRRGGRAHTSVDGVSRPGPRRPAGHDCVDLPAPARAHARARARARPVRPARRRRARRCRSWPDATIEVVDGCDHFLAGAIGRITDRAVGWLTAPDGDPPRHPGRGAGRSPTSTGEHARRRCPRSRRASTRATTSTATSPHACSRNRDTWVAVEGDAIVGFLVLEPGWVDHLYLEPSAPARASAPSCSTTPSACSPTGLDLWAFRSNTGARRFYERHGFVAVAFTEGDNEEGAARRPLPLERLSLRAGAASHSFTSFFGARSRHDSVISSVASSTFDRLHVAPAPSGSRRSAGS